MKRISLLLAGVLLSASAWAANVFDVFQPATGILKGDQTTYVTTAASAADIVGLWTGTCNSTTFLKGDGSCASAVTSFANPTASIGTTAVNGVATTAMRSDAAPAIDQTMSPTWTGSQTFNGNFLWGISTNASASGTNATLAAHSTPYIRTTNNTLVSIAKINTSGVASGHVVYVDNSTGNPVTITNNFDSSGAQIFTGTGTDVVLPANSVASFIYDGTGLHWNMLGGQLPNLTGLVLSNGTSAPTAYAGTSCTNQFPRSLNASGAATCASVSLTADTTGTLTVPKGGTGVATLTGLALGNGTSAMSAYTGTSCTNQFPRSLNASGAATCATVANTDLANSAITINGTSTSLGGSRSLVLNSSDFANEGTTTTVLHGNAAGNPSFGAVSLTADVSGLLPNANLANSAITINGTSTSLGGSRSLVLNSSDFANEGTTTTVLHGNAAGNPSFGAVSLTADVSGTLPVANGGTNLTSATDDSVVLGNGTTWTAAAVPNCGDSTHALAYNTTTNAFSCQAVTGSGGTPGGNSTNIQYNSGGAFAGSDNFVFDGTATVTLGTTGTTGGTIQGTARATGAGATFNILGSAGSAGANTGGQLNVKAGAGGSTGNGGYANIQGGAGGSTSGNGGNAEVIGGTATDGNGGNALVTGRAGVGTNRNGGTVTIQAGSSTGTGTPGNVTITSGTATDSNGSNVTLSAGNGVGTNRDAGNLILTGGTATGSGATSGLVLNNLTATGAQTATFSATNKPGSATGAPTLWLKVIVSNTTYWIPLFAN